MEPLLDWATLGKASLPLGSCFLTEEPHELWSEALWRPEVLSWGEKVVDKDGGQIAEVVARSLEEEKIQYWFPHQQGRTGVFMFGMAVVPVISPSARSAS